ncbi:MAG: hypothetical protein NZ942_00740, partial [Candidatus Aenigmarchaeota archaeon]|nr:hypothetical protein [Candidatus Aenigmarchaeota archaeon]
MEKVKELEEIEKEFKKNVVEKTRIENIAKMSSRMVSVIAKHLIKNTGYAAATTILQREFREIGKNDAKKIAKMFRLEYNNHKDASKALKIAA